MPEVVDYNRILKNVDNSKVVDRLVSIRCFFLCEMANPQGDTETNSPRVDQISGHGLITPVGLRRHIRDYVETRFGQSIFIMRNSNLAEQTRKGTSVHLLDVPEEEEGGGDEETPPPEAAESKKEKGPKGKKPVKTIMADSDKEQVITDVCRTYWDVRSFGQVLTKPVNRGITGPVQFTFGRSVHPIEVMPFTLTRCAVASDKEKETKDRTMGDSAATVVRLGLYKTDITINPNCAKRTGFTWEDANEMIDALQYMWTMKKATNRAGVNFKEMHIFMHKGPYCTVQEHRLFDGIKVEPKVEVPEGETFIPQNKDDFEIKFSLDDKYRSQVDYQYVS